MSAAGFCSSLSAPESRELCISTSFEHPNKQLRIHLDRRVHWQTTMSYVAWQASTVGSIVSIAFFNFFGLSVTKSLSGAARAAIDACRTILIWLFSVQVGWERFHGLQVSHRKSFTFIVVPCARCSLFPSQVSRQLRGCKQSLF